MRDARSEISRVWKPLLTPRLCCSSSLLAPRVAPRRSAVAPPTSPTRACSAPSRSTGRPAGCRRCRRWPSCPSRPTGPADSVVNLVVRHDMELSGQFEVLTRRQGAARALQARHRRSTSSAFRGEGAEYVLRVFAQPAAKDSAKTELVGEAYLTPTKAAAPQAAAGRRPAMRRPRPSRRTAASCPTATTEVRAASHRLVDLLLGALTGRPGGFASEMAYAEKVGRWRRVFAIDADGFDLRAMGPIDATALSPAFGPGNSVFYALSTDYSPFRLVFGPDATPVPMKLPGSVMGLAFSPDRKRMAVTAMDEGKSTPLDRRQRAASRRCRRRPSPITRSSARWARSPTSRAAPCSACTSTASPSRRPGFMASAPVFCDTPQGLLLVFTVGVGAGADIIATDTSGGNVRRLTQHEGANTYAACSPDGRLVSFFSTGKRGPKRRGPLRHAHPAAVAREEDLQRGRRVAALGAAAAREVRITLRSGRRGRRGRRRRGGGRRRWRGGSRGGRRSGGGGAGSSAISRRRFFARSSAMSLGTRGSNDAGARGRERLGRASPSDTRYSTTAAARAAVSSQAPCSACS